MRLETESVHQQTNFVNAPADELILQQANEALREGIRLAQSGDRTSARRFLLKATELNPGSEMAWLWLASISEYPEELLIFLNNVLEINPSNSRAIEWLKATKALMAKTFVARGEDALENGKDNYAIQCFNSALENDQNNKEAWMWLARLTESPEGKITYLEKVLELDPENTEAREQFDSARKRMNLALLAEARAAFVAGKKSEANELLDAFLSVNPESEEGWLLRSHIADSVLDKIAALEQVLKLNPENLPAKGSLESLKAIIATVDPSLTSGYSVSPQNDIVSKQSENDPFSEESVNFDSADTSTSEKENLSENTAFALDRERANRFEEIEKFPTEELKLPESLAAELAEIEKAQSLAETSESASLTFSDEPLYFEVPTAAEQDEKAEQLDAFPQETFPNELAEQNPADSKTDIYTESGWQDEALHSESQSEPAQSGIFAESGNTFALISESPQNNSEPEHEHSPWKMKTEVFNFSFTAGENAYVGEKDFDSKNSEPEVGEIPAPQDDLYEDIHKTQADSFYFAPAEEQGQENSFRGEGLESGQFDATDSQPLHIESANFESSNVQSASTESAHIESGEPIDQPDSIFADASAESDHENFVKEHSDISDEIENSPSTVSDLESFTPDVHSINASSETKDLTASFSFGLPTAFTLSSNELDKNDGGDFEPAAIEQPSVVNTVSEADAGVKTLDLAETVQIQPDFSSCPFCGALNPISLNACGTCLSTLTLTNLDLLFGNTHADRVRVLSSVQQMEAERKVRQLSAAELVILALGYINLRDFPAGYEVLEEALKADPDNNELASQVNNVRMNIMAATGSFAKPAATYSANKKILVIDDSATVRKLIAGKLEKCGHEVFTASDGIEALEMLKTISPDLILLDITMPRMDGYQVCKVMRGMESLVDVPIVMISGKDGFFDKVRGRMAGSTGYITKPFGPETLMKAVEMYLNGHSE
ncbi:MAG TPA: response regulator [Pyrinomonadaceae bacterium]|nr:response regulator [Pyrinomonadaceae bacterium]